MSRCCRLQFVVFLIFALGTNASRVMADQADEIDALRGIVAESADPVARREAVDKLKPHGRAAVPALRGLLAHPEPTVRLIVLDALGNLSSQGGEPRSHAAWPAGLDMLRLIEDPDVRVRRTALYNLGWFWSPHEKRPQRDDIAKGAVLKLAACLRDEDAKVREYASKLLFRLADVAWEAVPALVETLEDTEGAGRYARLTLLYLGPPERAYTARELIALLETEPTAEEISVQSDYEPSRQGDHLGLSRFQAVLYLGRKATDPAANTAGPLLLKLAEGQQPAVRFHALVASAKLGLAKESPLPILEAALAADDRQVAFWAAHALVELRGVEAHQAVGLLAATIPEREIQFTPLGPTPEQRFALLQTQLSVAALQRLGIRVPAILAQ